MGEIPGRFFAVFAVIALVVGSCSFSATDSVSCPVTIPSQPGFVPPPPYPPAPAGTNAAWYGTAELWTVLELDGTHPPRKSVWWSTDFAGGAEEANPDIAVTFRRLDIDAPPITTGSPGTNAHTEDGWFMIAGFDPQMTGCWEATASYRGAELSFVYLVP